MENSYETLYPEIKGVWTNFGLVKEGTEFPTLVMPEGIPIGPGIYRIPAPATNSRYEGEGKRLNWRLKNIKMPNMFKVPLRLGLTEFAKFSDAVCRSAPPLVSLFAAVQI